MLVLTRKVGEKILIGNNIEITVVRVSHNTVRIGVEAPQNCQIVREEIRGLPLEEPAGKADEPE